MCGIAGFAGAGTSTDLERMTTGLAHRGPDSSGYYMAPDDRVYLGHARLSILDIAGGHQPMTTEDGRFTVVFNGEIYNHHVLRAELEAQGWRFLTDHSDTEVLLIAYRAYGPEMVHRLNGMFAFTIYDKDEGTLFFARDRFGEKPFYYFHKSGCFSFASELTSLRQHILCPNESNETALIKFLGYGYVPSPHTMIKGCQKLPAGHAGLYNIRTGKLQTECYWTFRIEPQPIELNPITIASKTEELASLIQQSVKDRMVCDVPLGTLLSGGLDSSVITAFAQKANGQKVKTYSIGFREKSYDESAYSNQVATHLGTDHHLAYFDIDALARNMPDYLPFLDEPLGDASFLPTSLVCEVTRRDVTVALTGDGGDELFFGYDPFSAVQPAQKLAPLLLPPIRSALQAMTNLLPQSDNNMSLDFKLRRFLQGFEVSEPSRLAAWMAPLTPAQLSDLFGRPIREEEVYSEALAVWEDSKCTDPLDKMGEFFTRLYLADDILMKADRASMRVGLELRAPFLDYQIADFARTLPSSFKYNKGKRKFILKEVAARHLPPNIINRKKKGFGIPLSAWMRTVEPDSKGAGLSQINDEMTKRMRYEHKSRKKDWRYALWGDVVLSEFEKIKNAGA